MTIRTGQKFPDFGSVRRKHACLPFEEGLRNVCFDEARSIRHMQIMKGIEPRRVCRRRLAVSHSVISILSAAA